MKYNLPNNLKSKIYEDFNISKLTWFQTGGNVDIFCVVENIYDLKVILSYLPKDVKIFILGSGSNILVRDGGFNGVVFKLGKGFKNLSINNDSVISGSAVMDATLANFALKNSVLGLEFYVGIPGSVGGAIQMNSGCYGSETKDVVKEVCVIDRFGEEKIISLNELNFRYRGSSIEKYGIVKEVYFKKNIGNVADIKSKMNEIINKRRFSQPLGKKTGGSTFKNPEGMFAAKLIEESDCKGLQSGRAIISDKHSNFIINQGDATSSDIEILGRKVQEKVYKKFNVKLEWEIRIIGDHKK
ncbi:MAG: UDP-N-acetylenolpyruvoylglucosamine reductase [Alphaproteobacteria bacterium MarineAlpha5_Bin11]|nr:MAG: UDP-N-acetylenolpyruvoylglucosamine reductase [Alphaproteobacteria bacterium MarineAlpha5_Bin11]PPR51635.1 MAG: UDP-N-acetylenolpyruvoylglucosamine reductase [Alphaproteobacteria bacterium MarineAlpha5_Bin10]